MICVTKFIYKTKKIDFKISIKEGIFLEIDPHYLCQTVDNLIINALTFSKSGTIVIKLLLENNFVKFVITDQGKGIDKKQIYDVFTPFKMGCNTQSEGKGRGAGLALCKSVIEARNGEIKVKSNGKKGVIFWFLLPI